MESTFDDIFKNDVKSLKRDNLHLKLRVQQAENEINVFKRENLELKLRVQQVENELRMLRQTSDTILIDDKSLMNKETVKTRYTPKPCSVCYHPWHNTPDCYGCNNNSK